MWLHLGKSGCQSQEVPTLSILVLANRQPRRREKMSDNYWHESGLVFFTGGKGYGVHSTGATVCLGNEQSIKEAISKELVPSGISLQANETYIRIFEIIKENEGGYKSKTGGSSNFRARPVRDFEHRKAPVRRSAFTKRATVR